VWRQWLVSKAAAGTFGLEVHTLEIQGAQDIVPAFEALKGRADALYGLAQCFRF
jgi:ABC-type uncharacterized transport system substrate-binding protein